MAASSWVAAWLRWRAASGTEPASIPTLVPAGRESKAMKADIHPEYHEITIEMTDGVSYRTHSTWGKPGDRLRLEIDPKAHPAWVGGTQKLVEAGQLARFSRRFQNFGLR